MNLTQILHQLYQNPSVNLTETELQFLWQKEQEFNPFNLSDEIGLKSIKKRVDLFKQVHQSVIEECQKQGLTQLENYLDTLWRLWLPLSLQLAEQQKELKRPLIQGILGGQGTGKTTLCTILKLILEQLGYSTLTLSIDDLYLNPEDRQAKFPTSDPRYHYRGVPGTHEVLLAIKLLQQVKTKQNPLFLPRFDKSWNHGQGRRIEPEKVSSADIFLFEGWFVGVSPIDPKQFDDPLDPIVTEDDKNYARKINQDLQEYIPLWQELDRLMVLYPVDYHLSLQWRKEAENKMKASGEQGMSDEEIEAFVRHFWQSLHPQWFITPLTQNPTTELVVEINSDHSVGRIY